MDKDTGGHEDHPLVKAETTRLGGREFRYEVSEQEACECRKSYKIWADYGTKNRDGSYDGAVLGID